MSKIRKPHFFYCELYMVNIYLYENVPPKEVSTSLKKYLGFNYDSDRLEKSQGKALEFESGAYVIFINGKIKERLPTLAHECLHISNMILTDKGIEASLVNDEAQAYLLGWIMKKCLEKNK